MYPAKWRNASLDPLIHASLDWDGAAQSDDDGSQGQVEKNHGKQPQHYLSAALFGGIAPQLKLKTTKICISTRSRSLSSRFRP
jgi:hypothetical protein